MKLLYESELMKNQKQAQLLAPSGSLQVIQTSAGFALFFCIGSDFCHCHGLDQAGPAKFRCKGAWK